jgi:hypothetical protein
VNPVYTRENSESIINSIINDFTRGFQLQARSEHALRMETGKKSFMNVFDAFSVAMADPVKAADILSKEKYLYDPVLKQFHYNTYYTAAVHPKTQFKDTVNINVIKDFFNLYGININDKAFDKNEADIRKIYSKLTAVSDSYDYFVKDVVRRMAFSDRPGGTMFDKAKAISDINTQLREERSKDPIDPIKILDLEEKLATLQEQVRNGIRVAFPTNPVEELLYIGQDRSVRKSDYYKAFAITLPTFMDLAKIEKQYKDNYSSGSMVVLNGTEYSYFLPSSMSTVIKLIQHGVKTYDDFSKFPEIRHLNPQLNPQFANSWIFKNLFKDGSKIPGREWALSVISQFNKNEETGEKFENKLSTLTQGAKMLVDFLMTTREGSAEMRRNETSKLTFRHALVDTSKGDYNFIKPVVIGNDGFKDEDFLSQIRGYIQATAFMYKYDLTKEKTDRKDNPPFGVFEYMLDSKTLKSLKSLIAEKSDSYNLNSLFSDMEKESPDLFRSIANNINDYFEGQAITNPDSYINMMRELMSEDEKQILITLASTFKGRTNNGDIVKSTTVPTSFSGLQADPAFQRQIRDYIANDFIMAMEDSMLLFGDYSYYKDPIKRRKIISNNGSTNISDEAMANGQRVQAENSSLSAIYRQAKGLPKDSGKDFQLVRKFVMKDPKVTSGYINDAPDSEFIKDVQDWYKQFKGEDLTREQAIEKKKYTIEANKNIEIADSAAYISLDTAKKLLSREQLWYPKHDREYRRQQLILKSKLGQSLSDDEKDFVKRGPYAGFNIIKAALTGPEYIKEPAPMKPHFDKMGLKVLTPESDWETKQPLMEYMLENNIDYTVYDSGSKAYKPVVYDVWNKNGKGISKSFDKNSIQFTQHAGGYFKYQQNTAPITDKAIFAQQLRGTFFELMLLHRNPDGSIQENMKNMYDSFIQNFKDLIEISSARGLSSIGLNKDGRFITDENGSPVGRKVFIEKVRDTLIRAGNVDLSVLDKLNVNKAGDFTNFLESLPINREIYNVVAGIIDDNFRRVAVNGSKLYMTPEVGSGPKGEGTLGLKYHRPVRDEKGKIIATSKTQVMIPFKKNFHPLLNLKHSDGEKIGDLSDIERGRRRLNEMLSNPEIAKRVEEALAFIGIRIPLQNLNFTSPLTIPHFLPESDGDIIIAPPEFFKQIGGDNDIDTITCTFKYLDKNTGKVITKPAENYQELERNIQEVLAQLASRGDLQAASPNSGAINDAIDDIKEQMLQDNVFADQNKSESDMNDELSVVDMDGYKTFKGLVTKGGILSKFQKEGLHTDLMLALSDIVEDMNTSTKTVKDSLVESLRDATKKRDNYLKGVHNNMVNTMLSFYTRPEMFNYLTNTDAMAPIENIAKEVISMETGKDVKDIPLNERMNSLDSISLKNNIKNTHNTFELRSPLGAYVKFRRIFTTLVALNTELSQEYKGGNIDALSNNDPKKTYDRTIWTPTLSRKIEGGKIPLTLFDEKGDWISENMSMLISTELDLFKNMDTYPSLNISWNNVKPLIFLISLQKPMGEAIKFLNSPIVRAVEETRNALGPAKFALRHAIVKTATDLFGTAIYHSIPYVQNYEYMAPDGKSPNQVMSRHAKAAEAYLRGKFSSPADFKLKDEDVENFTRAFNSYRRSLKDKSPYDLKRFLGTDEGKKYAEMAENIMAYYSTLVEDGDLYYGMVIRKMDRDAVKYNNNAQIAEANKIAMALQNSKLVNSDFQEKVRNNSVFTPLFNDETVRNVIQGLMPHLYRPDIPVWNDGLINLIEKLSTQIYGDSETKRRIEGVIVGDVMEFLYKNFYYITRRDGNGNLLYNKPSEWFEKDIMPELADARLRSEIYKGKTDSFSLTENTATKLKNVGFGTNDDLLSSYQLFANQIELLRAKYPVLAQNLKLFKLLTPKRALPYFRPEDAPIISQQGDDTEMGTSLADDPELGDFFEKEQRMPKRPPITISEVVNALSQAYLYMNINPNPQTRFIDEQEIRDEWRKLSNFSTSEFPSIFEGMDEKTLAHYTDPRNVKELISFAETLGYFSLVQSSHLSKSPGSFSHLAPQEILSKVVEKSLSHFFDAISPVKTPSGKERQPFSKSDIDKLFQTMEKAIIESNTDLGFVVPQRAEGLRREKKLAGKPYSKFAMDSPIVKAVQDAIVTKLKKQGAILGTNPFMVDMTDKDSNDPFTLDCKSE